MKEKIEADTRVMRIYKPGAEGFVTHEAFERETINPTLAFPPGTFDTRFDYAIENPDGTLSWLQSARLYKGHEYAEFSGISEYKKKGVVIWRK